MLARDIEVAVISDIHLATHACKPKKVLHHEYSQVEWFQKCYCPCKEMFSTNG